MSPTTIFCIAIVSILASIIILWLLFPPDGGDGSGPEERDYDELRGGGPRLGEFTVYPPQ